MELREGYVLREAIVRQAQKSHKRVLQESTGQQQVERTWPIVPIVLKRFFVGPETELQLEPAVQEATIVQKAQLRAINIRAQQVIDAHQVRVSQLCVRTAHINLCQLTTLV